MLILPVLFGAGLLLFPLGDSRQPLKLTRRREHPDGSLELFYERPERSGRQSPNTSASAESRS